MDSDTNYFAFNSMFRAYTSSRIPFDCIKNADTSKKRKMRKEIARQLTKQNMAKKKKV